MATNDLTAQRLRELLSYDTETGVFTRLVALSNCHKVGVRVGAPHSNGYLTCRLFGATHLMHRLAWLHVHGVWPHVIDHINGRRDDNRLENLRDVSQKHNVQNVRRAASNNRSGLMGVHWRKDRQVWTAMLYTDGKQKRLGSFKTAEEAHAAYIAEKRRLHPGFTR